MYFRRILGAITASLSIAVIAISLLSPQRSPSHLIAFLKFNKVNSLTGLPGADGPVLIVKIDDTPEAHPQIGLDDADVVYIEQVEGGLTRLAAVFASKIPSQVGPIRSARISDIDLIAQYGRIGLAYSGVQKKMRPVINAANLVDLGAQNHSSTIYTNDVARTPPYAMVLRADLLMQLVKDRNIELASSKNVGWSFGDAPKSGTPIEAAHISWPANSYDAYWSAKEGRWLLDHAHSPDLSASGAQLGPKTLVIQNVSITDSIYKDKFGGITPFSATVGSGSGYILRDGMYFEATWNRPSADAGTSWRSLDGAPIHFARGQIWVALTDKAPSFTP